MKNKIVIAGSGGIGKAAGLILAESKDFDCEIYFGDISQSAIDGAIAFVEEGLGKSSDLHGFLMPMSGSNEAMDKAFADGDVVLDCLPGSQAPRIAQMAKDNHTHYANLTEYVSETNQVMEIAKDADTAFVLQTGLAPGFINVLACKIWEDFTADFGVEKADRMEMKVGALSDHAAAPHFYAFTWSPIGVATEYMKDAEIVRDFQKIAVPALSGRETIIIDGEEFEDNFTSGGAADLPEAFAGKVKDLDYKTLRYAGHYEWVEETLKTIPKNDDTINNLEKLMLDRIPSVEDDVVIVYAAVTGKDSDGRLRRKERAYKIAPSYYGKQKLRAIQTTTAAPLCEMARMMIEKDWKGTVLQSQIDTDEFMNGPFVKRVYGAY